MEIEKLIKPFWETNVVFEETVLLISENAEPANGRLFFKPEEIISVTQTDGSIEYIEGKDWYLEHDRICRINDSNIPYLNQCELYFKEKKDEDSAEGKNGGFVLWKRGATGFFASKQIKVTYVHNDTYTFDIGIYGGERLNRIKEKLYKKENCTICFYGDSITEGYDCSGFLGLKPNMPKWAKLVTETLQKKYGTSIRYVNTAVAGMNSDWGVKNVKERLANYCPEVAVGDVPGGMSLILCKLQNDNII